MACNSPPNTAHIIVLVATADRAELLESRCLPSIVKQSCTFDRIVLVDDSNDADQSKRIEVLVNAQTIGIDLLRNRRTHGAAGAWNTGLDHIARLFHTPSTVHVAILDDDDAWESDHLEHAIYAIQHGAEIVASAFRRIVDNGPGRLIMPPSRLSAELFLVGNPGIQASNLIVRLDRLLEAGGFDEALRSCTDRDLCIRLARTCHDAYARIEIPTVRHYACPDRPRVSTPGSAARNEGLNAFFAKHRPLMSEEQRTGFKQRAHRYFDWTPDDERFSNALQTPEIAPHTFGGSIQLVVGMIVDSRRANSLHGLLDEVKKS